jgi:hypothetical protein
MVPEHTVNGLPNANPCDAGFQVGRLDPDADDVIMWTIMEINVH